MDQSKLHNLRQIEVAKPCPEAWDKMEGDQLRRFCAGCGCHVHNISALEAEEAESLIASPKGACIRMQTDPSKGILTRSGWVPRLLLAGAIAAVNSGCTTTTGEASAPSTNAPPVAKKATPPANDTDQSLETVGWAPIIAKRPA